MHALRTCDFCDGDAAGTFEVLPPRLEPTEAEQRRVVLCPDCKARLEDLLEPLLARAGEAPPSDSRPERTPRSSPNATDSTPDSAETDEGDEPSTDATSDATDDTDDEVGGQVDAGNDEPDTANAETAAERDAETDTGPEDDSASDTSTEDSASDPLLEDGITFERSEPVESAAEPEAEKSVASEPEETAEDESEAADTERETDATESERSSADGSETADDADGSAAQQAAKRPPRAYGKVMRLLRNRHFPMQRSAVEELAAGAYDLEAHEAAAVVDHAVDRGEFVESRDLLERPDS